MPLVFPAVVDARMRFAWLAPPHVRPNIVSESSTAWSTGYNYLLRLFLGALGEDDPATYFSQSRQREI